jgi:hypothetical protein
VLVADTCDIQIGPTDILVNIQRCEISSLNTVDIEHSGLLRCYEGRSESKERFAIQRYLLIVGKKKNMQVLSRTFTYFST